MSDDEAAVEAAIDEANAKFQSYEVWGVARQIPTDQLILTDWNCNEMTDNEFATLIDEVEDGGFDEPCQVVPIPEGPNAGKFLVVGGEHRYKSCVALEKKTVPCVLKDHLDPQDREALMEYSVRRNNVRGHINAQKYAEVEAAICRKTGLKADMARQRMMVRGETLKKLRKTGTVRDNEDKDRGATGSAPSEETDGEKDKKKSRADRAKLMEDLKAIEQEVLLESGDTVDHGYLYFGQGGKNHLVVEESKKLYAVVKEMVAKCKGESARVDEFLFEAISAKLKAEKE